MTWNKTDIERARTTDLARVLAEQGFTVNELPASTFVVPEYRGLVIHGNTWLWKAQDLRGNTIDFFMILLGHTFDETMRLLCPAARSHQLAAPNDARDEEEDEMP